MASSISRTEPTQGLRSSKSGCSFSVAGALKAMPLSPSSAACLAPRRGKRLQVEWTGFALHMDDKLQPGTKVKPKEMAGMVEARIDGAAIEFLVPA